MSADAKVDGCTLQQDVGKHLEWTEFKDHGVHSSMELYDLFGDVFDNLRNANPLRWGVASPHLHHGAVPDIGATFPVERRQLYEVKCMHENPTCYPLLCSWWYHACEREVCLWSLQVQDWECQAL
jgi:hypothetical protein